MPPSNLRYMVLILICIVQFGVCWKNNYDELLHFVCPTGNMISYIRSIHNNGPEDRLWDFRCRKNKYSSNRCSWSGWVNDWDETFRFQCRDNGYIAGIYSRHDNGPEDRRYEFYCCQTRGKVYVHSCYYTNPNGFDREIRETVPYGYAWKGVISNHDNGPEDRQFSFQLCRMN